MTDTTPTSPKSPRRTRPTLLTRALAAPAALALAASSALAQGSSAPLRPPTPGELKDAPMILTIIVTVVLFALVMTAAVFPSKRGHQD